LFPPETFEPGLVKAKMFHNRQIVGAKSRSEQETAPTVFTRNSQFPVDGYGHAAYFASLNFQASRTSGVVGPLLLSALWNLMRTSPSLPSSISVGFTLALVAGTLALPACSSDDAISFDEMDSSVVVGGDAAPEGSATDGTKGDAGHDAEAEASQDAGAEAAERADGGAEASPDAGAEAGREAGGDDARRDATDGAPREAASDAPLDISNSCGARGVLRVAPIVPPEIDVPDGVSLLGGYHGSGYQVYTCIPLTAVMSDVVVSGTWVSTSVAVLYDDDCSPAISHSYTATLPLRPTWTSLDDGSSVVATRETAAAAPADGSSSGAVTWVRFRAVANSLAGLLANVTYIQRVDTVGGVGPAGACDPASDAGTVLTVPYSATYYFYTGRPATSSDAAVPSDAEIEDGATHAQTDAPGQ